MPVRRRDRCALSIDGPPRLLPTNARGCRGCAGGLRLRIRESTVIDDISSLAELRERFNDQYFKLFNFFQDASALRFLTSLIAVPQLDSVRHAWLPSLGQTPARLTRAHAPRRGTQNTTELRGASRPPLVAAGSVRHHPRPVDAAPTGASQEAAGSRRPAAAAATTGGRAHDRSGDHQRAAGPPRAVPARSAPHRRARARTCPADRTLDTADAATWSLKPFDQGPRICGGRRALVLVYLAHPRAAKAGVGG